MGIEAMNSLFRWEREGARRDSGGKGEGGKSSALTLPALRAPLPLPRGEGG